MAVINSAVPAHIAERQHDSPSRIDPFIARALEDIVEDLMDRGVHPLTGCARLTLQEFCEEQSDCGQLLACVLTARYGDDRLHMVRGWIEKRLRAYLEQDTLGIVSSRAADLAQSVSNDREE